MFTLARTAALLALAAVFVPAYGQDIIDPDSATCTLPNGDISAGALAVVRFGETLTVNALTLANPVTAQAVIDICLCAQVAVDTGFVYPPTTSAFQTSIEAATALYLLSGVNAGLSGIVGATALPGAVLTIEAAPTDNVTPCPTCSPTQFQTCVAGVCDCADCPAGQLYNPTVNACRLPPSQAAGGPNRVRRSYAHSSFAKNQARRSDVVARIGDVVQRTV